MLSKGCEVKVVAAFPHYPHGKIPKRYRYKAIVSEKAGNVKLLRVWLPALPHNSVVKRALLHISFIFSSLFALPFVGDFDIIWAANPNLFCFFSALLYSLVKRKPIVRNVDDLWPEVFYELGFVKSKLARKVLDFLAWLSYVVPMAITPISGGYKRWIVERYGIYVWKVHVIEVGVDKVTSFSVIDHESRKDMFVVMYSGILGLGYNFDVVLRAAYMLRECKDIVFVIRGMGELAPSLQRRVRELGLENVVLYTSFLSKEKLSALLSSADVFLLPMPGTGFVDFGLPAKVFEYQAYGKPIVCCSEGESARYVRMTKSGLVVKPNDPEALVQAILKLYKDRKLAYELGLNGWRHVSQNLTCEKIGERMYNVFMWVKSVW
ncbi:MAG: glycosyltransferase family 4 protein [Thermoproteota archaeon]